MVMLYGLLFSCAVAASLLLWDSVDGSSRRFYTNCQRHRLRFRWIQASQVWTDDFFCVLNMKIKRVNVHDFAKWSTNYACTLFNEEFIVNYCINIS